MPVRPCNSPCGETGFQRKKAPISAETGAGSPPGVGGGWGGGNSCPGRLIRGFRGNARIK